MSNLIATVLDKLIIKQLWHNLIICIFFFFEMKDISNLCSNPDDLFLWSKSVLCTSVWYIQRDLKIILVIVSRFQIKNPGWE